MKEITGSEARQYYREFTDKMATIYGLEPKEKFICSLIKTVPFQDLTVEMDLILEQLANE
jgi:hypothetical protein